MSLLQGKKVAMVIAPENFRDEELQEPRQVLEQEGARVDVVSTSLEPAQGMLGASVLPQRLLSDLDLEEYDCLVFVGGTGAARFWEDARAHQLAREAVEQGRILGAICIAPVILARAGLLQGKAATVYPSEKQQLQRAGARVQEKPVVRDGLIVTGERPAAAREFGRELVQAMSGQ